MTMAPVILVRVCVCVQPIGRHLLVVSNAQEPAAPKEYVLATVLVAKEVLALEPALVIPGTLAWIARASALVESTIRALSMERVFKLTILALVTRPSLPDTGATTPFVPHARRTGMVHSATEPARKQTMFSVRDMETVLINSHVSVTTMPRKVIG